LPDTQSPAQPTQAASATTPPLPGQYWPAQGGWYAGIQRSEDCTSGWHLILPQGDQFVLRDVIWGKRGQTVKGADHLFDGMVNTLAMVEAGSELAQRIRALPGDCYLPSRFESALLYATVREQIELGDWYWTSTQYSSRNAWMQDFGLGDQDNDSKSSTARAVAVRRLTLQSLNPLDVGS
jgi:hypothetical protein